MSTARPSTSPSGEADVPRALLVDLGIREYGEIWELQRRVVERRQAGEIEDVILFVEHPPVFTLGRAARDRRNLLAPGDAPVFEIERGGDVTFHGPGQLVCYPILLLRESSPERDLHRYLRALEEALIRTAAAFGLAGERRAGLTGLWVAGRKLASIGVAVKRWVTMHGVALNVTADLAWFERINPCGLSSGVMSSLAASGGRGATMDAAKAALADSLGPCLERRLVRADCASLERGIVAPG